MQFKASLISKINFPKWVIIVASNITSLLTLGLNLIIFSAFFIFSKVMPEITMLLFIFYLLQVIIFSFSVSLILSSFYLKFKDLMHLWGVLLQMGFWLTPIIYPITMIPENIRQLFFLNPMARIITDSRYVLIYNQVPTLRHNIISCIILALFFFFGIWIFNKRSPKFAEEI